MADTGRGSSWLAVWTRAVVRPAWRRALAVWAGTGIAAAVIFGPTGLHAGELTRLAVHNPGVFAVLAATWTLLFVPIARVLVRAEGARYLRSLPGPWLAPIAITAGALLALQLPWLALWVKGDGARGLTIVAALTAVILGIAWWRPPLRRIVIPAWRSGGAALRSIQLRGVRRRAGDALVRGAGLAVLAGGAGGLLVRNNELTGSSAGVLAASIITFMLVPAQVGVLLVILDTHRATGWLAASLGIAQGSRVAAITYAIALVHLAGALIAVVAASIACDADAATAAWLALITVVVSIASAFGEARVLLGAGESPSVAVRAAIGALVVAALAVFLLGLFDVAGLAAIGAGGLYAVLTVRA